MPVFGEQEYPEDIRLKYRFLDLRRERLHRNIMMRGAIIDSIRRRMKEQGFFEFQTPILTASSPEGARDYLVPSRLHPGKFYALPQAPQQFKQLIMMSGFDRYFQIAPCFRDEDARADRSPGEFYQLDLEMSFVTQQDVFDAVEPVMRGVFEEFAGGKPVTQKFPLIPYADAMLKYGSDKPDLRNPLVIADVTAEFNDAFRDLQRLQEHHQGGWRRARDSGARGGSAAALLLRQARSNGRGNDMGAHGLGYIVFEDQGRQSRGDDRQVHSGRGADQDHAQAGVQGRRCGVLRRRQAGGAAKLAGAARTKIAEELGLITKERFEFCWIVDFPMYEWNDTEKKIDFSHNPFSMPNHRGGRVSGA